MLGAYGFKVMAFASGENFLVECARQLPACAIVDVRMPGINGLELLNLIRQRGWNFRVIVITGHGEVETAVRAMKLGAADFLQKPFRPEQLLSAIKGNNPLTPAMIFKRNHAPLNQKATVLPSCRIVNVKSSAWYVRASQAKKLLINSKSALPRSTITEHRSGPK